MPQPRILKIAEIFSSLQGEGSRQGEPTLFIRFAGCNLKCTFCDTKYAWSTGKEMPSAAILEKALHLREKFPAEWVCLTGGEPLMQEVDGLVKKIKKENFKVQVETNGTFFRSMPVDWYTVSPKPDKYFYQPEFKKKASEVKVVVTKELNFKVIQRLREEFLETIPILLQPQSNRKWSMDLGLDLTTKAVVAGLKNIRLSLQLHKIYGFK